MQDHGLRIFLKVSDLFLCHPVLVVSTNSTEGDGLLRLMRLDGIKPQAVGKLAVVGMVVADYHTMQRRIRLKSSLGFHCLLGSSRQLQETKGELTEMVNKYCCSLVPLEGQCPFYLADESWCRRFELVNEETPAASCHRY
jgi:hypothetical protein